MIDTIVALATPPIKSALAVIRVSGDKTLELISKVFSKDISKITKRDIFYGNIVDKEVVIDEVVLLAYVAPHSFTGENSVEIICHGSMIIANEIIELIISKGARYATNGEYSSRAFLNRRIDLIQAEAINDVINSTTKEAKKLSIMSLEGKTSTIFEPIKTSIADLLSLIEVNIDYPEYKDIEVANRDKVISSCEAIHQEILKLISTGKQAKLIKEGIKVAIVGKPNVGKSSLLNALLKEDKAIVTDIAGTTRDIVEGDIVLNGVALHLLDTAGIRESKDIIEDIGINKSKRTINNADLVILVLDASNITKEDLQLMALTKEKKTITVYNKADTLSSFDPNKLYISALNKDVAPLINEIIKILAISDDAYDQPSLNNARQLGLLNQIDNYLIQVIEDAKNDLPIDILSINLMAAYNSSLDILGEGSQIDFTKEIFSRFCVGK